MSMNKGTLDYELAKLGLYQMSEMTDKEFKEAEASPDSSYVKTNDEFGVRNMKIHKDDFSSEDVIIYFLMNLSKNIKTLRNMVAFFVVLSIISIVLAVIFGVQMMPKTSF